MEDQTLEEAIEALEKAYATIDHYFQEGVLFYPSQKKTIEITANDLKAIINDPFFKTKQ